MIEIIKKRCWLVALAVIALLLVFLMYRECEGMEAIRGEEEIVLEDCQLYALDEVHTVEQSFVMHGDLLESIDILLSGFEDTDTSIVKLFIEYDGHSVYGKLIPVSDFRNGEFTRIEIGARLNEGESYVLRICADIDDAADSDLKIAMVSKEQASELCQELVYGGDSVSDTFLALHFSRAVSTMSFSKLSRLACLLMAAIFLFLAKLTADKEERERLTQEPVRRISTVEAYCLLTIAAMGSLVITIFLSNGEVLSHFFWYVQNDTGMDFFHSIEYLRDNKPYELFGTLYPPLANLFFQILYHCVPYNVKNNWTLSFEQSIHMKGTNHDLRTQQAPMLLYLVFLIAVALILCNMIEKLFKDAEKRKSIALCCLLSYGVLTAFERGNIVVISLIFALLFILHRNDEHGWKRELSYVCLAIAAGLKLYPAVYGLLLLKERKWGAAARTVLYGIAAIFIPFLFFEEGISGSKIWIQTLLSSKANSPAPWAGNGLSCMLARCEEYLSGWIGQNAAERLTTGMLALLLASCIIAAFLEKNEWKTILMLSFALCVVKNQGDYIFCFMLIPLLVFLKLEPHVTKRNVLPFICMLGLVLPIPVFYVRSDSFPRYGISHGIYVVLLMWCVTEGIRSARKRIRG